MNNITPVTPSLVYGYWRPWKENSSIFDSYLDYTKDTTLVKYAADIVGEYISQASQEQVQAINQLGKAIGMGLDVLSNQMSDINSSLIFLNRNMDIQIEQQKLSNLLLQNITELLRVPESEKERQHSIELGIKFFVNAKKDSDLYTDALEELLKAESLMKQDYFVLHRIGCIYLYVEKYINPEKALEYFVKAAKYASVESDVNAVRLVNILTNNFNSVNSEINDSETQIGLLAADSYEKAAFASYILGQFEDAVNYQKKAFKFNPSAHNQFNLAKYQVRNENIIEAIENLDKSIDKKPAMAIAVFKEIDLLNEPMVIKLLENKNQNIDSKIKEFSKVWESVESSKSNEMIIKLNELLEKSYEIKVIELMNYEKDVEKNSERLTSLQTIIDEYIVEIKQYIYESIYAQKIEEIINELKSSKSLSLEKMEEVFDKIKHQIDSYKVKVGSRYAGGIVIYLNDTGKHGLVCSETDFIDVIWGVDNLIRANGNGVADGSGTKNTKKIHDLSSWYIDKSFFGEKKYNLVTAACLCLEYNHNGYTDWYLPTLKELGYIFRIKDIVGVFAERYYLSSTEYDSKYVWTIGFISGMKKNIKGDLYYARAVRVF